MTTAIQNNYNADTGLYYYAPATTSTYQTAG